VVQACLVKANLPGNGAEPACPQAGFAKTVTASRFTGQVVPHSGKPVNFIDRVRLDLS